MVQEYLTEMFGLEGKIAVVTGGTGVVCGEMAKGLAKAGAEVVLAGRDQSKADAHLADIEAAGGKGYFVAVEVLQKNSVQALLDTVLEKSGKCDILVNGAGANAATPFFDIDEDEYDRIMDINIKALFQSCQVFGKYFVDNKVAASIINLGSMTGLVPLSRVFTYCISKAAVHNLSKNLAREWAPNGIRVNTLVPGFFPAEQNRKIIDEKRKNSILTGTPMDRFGEPHELIGATLLMASNKAGSFITGSEVVVDGGFAGNRF